MAEKMILTCWWPELVAVRMWSKGSFNGFKGCFKGSLDKESGAKIEATQRHMTAGCDGHRLTGLS